MDRPLLRGDCNLNVWFYNPQNHHTHYIRHHRCSFGNSHISPRSLSALQSHYRSIHRYHRNNPGNIRRTLCGLLGLRVRHRHSHQARCHVCSSRNSRCQLLALLRLICLMEHNAPHTKNTFHFLSGRLRPARALLARVLAPCGAITAVFRVPCATMCARVWSRHAQAPMF